MKRFLLLPFVLASCEPKHVRKIEPRVVVVAARDATLTEIPEPRIYIIEP